MSALRMLCSSTRSYLSHSSARARLIGVPDAPGRLLFRWQGLSTSFAVTKDEVKLPDNVDPGNYEMIFPHDPPLWGTAHISRKTVPEELRKPSYARAEMKVDANERHAGELYTGDGLIRLGSSEEDSLRRACRLASMALRKARELAKVGVTTEEIDHVLHHFVISSGAYPSPLGYMGFPKSCCTSVNNIVVHGIPDSRKLVDGDIINIDVTVYIDGFHGDTSNTFLVGEVDDIGRHLVESTEGALEAGIQACGPGKPFKGIGQAIRTYIGSKNLSVSEQFTGHGIGRVFHRPPWIYHCKNDEPGMMVPGQCFTIEPALIFGSDPRAWVFPDGWTASTMNGNRSAQAEHTLLITDDGVDVLTR